MLEALPQTQAARECCVCTHRHRHRLLLSRLQGDLNLNICEAHAFNTKDKFSLDVFVVNGWRGEVRSCIPIGWKQSSGLPRHRCRGCCTGICTTASRNSWLSLSREGHS